MAGSLGSNRASSGKAPGSRSGLGSAGSPRQRPDPRYNARAPGWTFLTNHAHVLLSLAEDSRLRIRDLAARVGITERAVQRIISDLEEAGYLTHERDGRRNTYRVRLNRPLRHPLQAHQTVAALLETLRGSPR